MTSAVEVIATKRDGGELTSAQIDWVLEAFVRGEVADEQMSALLMAIVWRGMSAGELSAWTGAMVASGERMDLSGVGRPVVDKHSSGGVGDKVSLVVAPLVASLGAAVPKLSGRGLGHTGGTLDKLESIPGWRGELSQAQFVAQLREVGAVIGAAGPSLAPADKRLYALRDVTGTVPSIPLIASSIMSKKIAGGADAVLLDVKVGAGAFMRELEPARELARTMVQLGRDAGVRTVCLLTSMEAPLGRAVGNAVEVREAVEVLSGAGPADLLEVCVTVAAEMLALSGKPLPPPLRGGWGALDPALAAPGRSSAQTSTPAVSAWLAHVGAALRDGRALAVWRQMITAQGGDPDAASVTAPCLEVLRAPRSGIITRVDALAVGSAAWRLGAGRARQGDAIDHAAGIVLASRLGQHVEVGDRLLTMHAATPERIAEGRAALAEAYHVDDTGQLEPHPGAARRPWLDEDTLLVPPLILERVE